MSARGAGPEFCARARFDVAERIDAVPYGGLAAIHRLAQELGLVDRLDAALHLFKVHHPYWESDHILNIAFNGLCGGRTLDDIEVRRNDVAFLDMLGARMIPDPTTAGDFCRRFDEHSIGQLMDAINAHPRRGVAPPAGEVLRGNRPHRGRRQPRAHDRRVQGRHGHHAQGRLGLSPAPGLPGQHGRAPLHRQPQRQPSLA
jgi:hypothetical protein